MTINYSIILPCLNEYENLKYLITDLIKRLKNEKYEILVIDDNSTDNTIPKLKKKFYKNKKIILIKRTKNPGLAFSIKTGINKCLGKNIIVMDSDFNHKPNDVIKLIKIHKQKKFELICGSRFAKGGSSNKFYRHILSLAYNYLIIFILNGKIIDNLSGFFLIKKKKLMLLNLNKIFYGYGDYYIRLLYYSQKFKFKYFEVGVKYGNRKHGHSKSNFIKMFINYFIETLKIKINEN
tara:strand:- start:995 stop:1702 length:708 start_codon:yes stop_codon:yes gene_type:complete